MCGILGLQNEVKLLLDLLPRYYEHVEKHPHTLLIKFYGLHRVVPLNGSKVSTGYLHCAEWGCTAA